MHIIQSPSIWRISANRTGTLQVGTTLLGAIGLATNAVGLEPIERTSEMEGTRRAGTAGVFPLGCSFSGEASIAAQN